MNPYLRFHPHFWFSILKQIKKGVKNSVQDYELNAINHDITWRKKRWDLIGGVRADNSDHEFSG